MLTIIRAELREMMQSAGVARPSRRPPRPRWTPAEDRLLTYLWDSPGIDVIAEQLPGRTPAGVRNQAVLALRLGPMAARRCA